MVELLKRKSPKLVVIALAKKIARISWKMMVTGATYRQNAESPKLACAA
ncbi:hypothetical protein GHK78_10155 [Sinorhizobium meliloti]|nr:hypothetical protein [Sinorhizobium meliloti]MDW9835965.1 hypothetical protein [Sinorhizobium meliloti]MDX0040346.1 hypothetical protein [Sinorhizobium meliloti]MDX0088868.1 hypothetical protein [Sinorhizobium meliloti]MQX63407.1 hypothetical protein [Sinorhizobium meliloti]